MPARRRIPKMTFPRLLLLLAVGAVAWLGQVALGGGALVVGLTTGLSAAVGSFLGRRWLFRDERWRERGSRCGR